MASLESIMNIDDDNDEAFGTPRRGEEPRNRPTRGSSTALPGYAAMARPLPAHRQGHTSSTPYVPSYGQEAGSFSSAHVSNDVNRRRSNTSNESSESTFAHGYAQSSASATAPLRQYPTSPTEGESSSVRLTPITRKPSRAKKGVPVHVCELCRPPKVFTRAEHLRRHRLSHEPPALACLVEGCDKVFHRKDLLDRHQQRHEQEQQAIASDEYSSGRPMFPDTTDHVYGSLPPMSRGGRGAGSEGFAPDSHRTWHPPDEGRSRHANYLYHVDGSLQQRGDFTSRQEDEFVTGQGGNSSRAYLARVTTNTDSVRSRLPASAASGLLGHTKPSVASERWAYSHVDYYGNRERSQDSVSTVDSSHSTLSDDPQGRMPRHPDYPVFTDVSSHGSPTFHDVPRNGTTSRLLRKTTIPTTPFTYSAPSREHYSISGARYLDYETDVDGCNDFYDDDDDDFHGQGGVRRQFARSNQISYSAFPISAASA